MEGFIGEVRMFAGNFAPRSWAFCEGQLMSIAQNSALFSILGTTYGGDGINTFAIPDLRGRAPVGHGHGPGLSDRPLGQKGGADSYVLNITQMPSHNHVATAHTAATSTSADPTNGFPADLAGRSTGTPPANIQANGYGTTADAMLNPAALVASNAGGSQSLNNMQPTIAINYIIAVYGIYPSRG